MKWFGRDWTADSSLRVVGRAQSGTENFADVSFSSQHVEARGMSFERTDPHDAPTALSMFSA